MSASTTRLLLLGAVALFEPINGYQIRRELMSWRVDEWASINPGSIYHGLRRLAEQELLVATAVDDGGREVIVYEMTDAGRQRLRVLAEAAIEEVNVFDRRAFLAAFALLPAVGEVEAEAALRERRAKLAAEIDALVRDGASTSAHDARYEYVPPHAMRTHVLWMRMAWSELEWLDETITELHDGTLSLGPESGWTPPSDDPAHEMAADRERYRRALGRS